MARRNDSYYPAFIPTANNIGGGRRRKVNKNCPAITPELIAEATAEYLREGGTITMLDASGGAHGVDREDWTSESYVGDIRSAEGM